MEDKKVKFKNKKFITVKPEKYGVCEW